MFFLEDSPVTQKASASTAMVSIGLALTEYYGVKTKRVIICCY